LVSRPFKLLISGYYRKAGPMNARGMKIVGCLLILVCATGCATMSDVVLSKEQGKGTSRIYRVNVDQAWEITKVVFRLEQTDAVEEHRSEGYMLTSIRETLVRWGAVMGIWIEPVNGDSTRVTVVIKRKNPIDVFPPLTEADFHEDFELAWRMTLKKPAVKP
jgi:hypothetical protein